MSSYDVFKNSIEPKTVGQFYLDSNSGCHTVKLIEGAFTRFELHPSNCPLSDYDYVIQGANGFPLGYAYLKTSESDVFIEMELTQADQSYFTVLPKNKFSIAA